VFNTFDGGAAGVTLSTSNTGGPSGEAFDDVRVDPGATLVFDATHVRGSGLAAKHIVRAGQSTSYGWDDCFGVRALWYGRVYVWVERLRGDLRVVRAVGAGAQGAVVELTKQGKIRIRNASGTVLATSAGGISLRGWVRLEWKIDHTSGVVEVKIFSNPDATTPTETLSVSGAAIGAFTDTVEFFTPGNATLSATFWTEDAAAGWSAYLGPAV
jgi:hypothetical protein